MFSIQLVFHDGTVQTFMQEQPLVLYSYVHHYVFKPMLDKRGKGYYGVSIPFASVRMVFTTEVVDPAPVVANADISSAPVEPHHAPDVEGREPDICES